MQFRCRVLHRATRHVGALYGVVMVQVDICSRCLQNAVITLSVACYGIRVAVGELTLQEGREGARHASADGFGGSADGVGVGATPTGANAVVADAIRDIFH